MKTFPAHNLRLQGMIQEEQQDVAGRKQSFDGLRLEKDGLRQKGGEIPVKREMKGHLKLRRRTRQIRLGRVGRDAGIASKVDRVHPIDQ